MRRIFLAVLFFAMFASVRFAEALTPDGPSSSFTVTLPTAVPGLVLPAGSFKMIVVDHLSDRYVMRVEDRAGNMLAMFLAVEDPQLASHAGTSAGTGLIPWNASDSASKRYVRGWTFPENKLALEFVYPKTDAVAIAQMNHTRVAAIDPASDGLVVKSGLSGEDLQIVTLWLLTPTHVGAGDHRPGVAGARYEPAPEPQQPLVAQGVKAVARTPLPSSAYVQTLQPSQTSRAAKLALQRLAAQQKKEDREARLAARQPTQVAQLEAPPLPSARRTTIAKLPHTASNLGLVWLIGLVATSGAAGLRMRRLALSRA